MSETPFTLLTFAPMVDSETSRLLLAHYDASYVERDHMFGWVSLLAMLHGGGAFIPYLYGGGLKLTGPRPIADHFDPALPEPSRLIPADAALSAQVEADWKTFNGQMGADTAVFSYFHLLPERKLMSPIFADPVPPIEALLTPILYPVLRMAFTKLLHLSPEAAAAAEARIRSTFADTDKRVADGRPYLCGERMTLGDIGLAAASAPLLLPPGYGAKMPPIEAMPAPVAALMRDLQQSPTGGFVKRLYSTGFAAARQRASA
jgi:glutathione S-transferase